MARVLLTRPLGQQADTSSRLEAMGHEVVAEPLLHLENLDTPAPTGPFAAVLLTSTNAAPAAARAIPRTDRPTRPVLATGQATADAAQKAGFGVVHNVGGDASDLARFVNEADIDLPATLPLLWPRAETIARDLTDLIKRKTVPWIVYRMVSVAEFSKQGRQLLVDARIDAVLLTSPRIARTFATLFHRLPDTTPVPPIFAMSSAIRDSLPDEMVRKTRVSVHPSESALLDLLATHGR